jgi:hypothetical protein
VGVDRGHIDHWGHELGYFETWRQVAEAADAPDRPPGPAVP